MKILLFVLLVAMFSIVASFTPLSNKKTHPSPDKNLLNIIHVDQVPLDNWAFSDTGGYGMMWGVPDEYMKTKASIVEKKTSVLAARVCDFDNIYFDGVGGGPSCWESQ